MEIQDKGILDLCIEYKTEIIAVTVALFFLVLIFFVGGILASGIALGLISSVGFTILFVKAREYSPGVYSLMVRHPFMTDAVTTVLGYLLFGLTVNGMIAAGVFSIINTVILMMAHKYDPMARTSVSTFSFRDFIRKHFSRNSQASPIVEEPILLEANYVVH